MESRVKGIFATMAYGDALGGPHEFYQCGTPIESFTGRLQFPYVKTGGRFHPHKTGVVGQVTDDTEMTCALLRAIHASGGDYQSAVAVREYQAWAQTRAAMGRNTRFLFGPKSIQGYETRWAQIFGPFAPAGAAQKAQSNGCLMRATGLILCSDPLTAAAADCWLTNPNLICMASVQVYVRAILFCLSCQDGEAHRTPWLSKMLQAAICGCPATAELPSSVWRVVQHALTEDGERDVTGRDKGWVLHALWCAFRALRAAVLACEGGPAPARTAAGRGKAARAALVAAVARGGDCDTNGAVAGGLLGAWCGGDALRRDPEARADLEILLAVTAEKTAEGDVPRPAEYTALQLMGLVHRQYATAKDLPGKYPHLAAKKIVHC